MAKLELEPGELILQHSLAFSLRGQHTVHSELVVTDRRIVLASEKQPRPSGTAMTWRFGIYGLIGFVGRTLGRLADGYHVTHDIARDDVASIEANGDDIRVSSAGEGYGRIWFDVRLANQAGWLTYLGAWSRGEEPPSLGVAASAVKSTAAQAEPLPKARVVSTDGDAARTRSPRRR